MSKYLRVANLTDKLLKYCPALANMPAQGARRPESVDSWRAPGRNVVA
jgi:hypothetical protein